MKKRSKRAERHKSMERRKGQRKKEEDSTQRAQRKRHGEHRGTPRREEEKSRRDASATNGDRQQLEVLRDLGLLTFLGAGSYRFT
jgi:hypothetical protein